MLGKLTSKVALVTGDVGSIIPASDFNKVDADDYIISEKAEKIYFVIKSKKDEYCFTDRALIHVDGESVASSKRTVRRYEYVDGVCRNITIETAGNMDADVELHFELHKVRFSIDVRKDQLDKLKDLYKALIEIERKYDMDWIKIKSHRTNVDDALKSVATALSSARVQTINITEQVAELEAFLNKRYDAIQETVPTEYSEIFELMINNE